MNSPRSPKKAGSSTSRPSRKERLAEMARRDRARQRRRAILIWGSGAVVILALAAVVTVAVVRTQANRPDLAAAVQTYEVSQGHVATPVQYDQTPPAGGEHAPVWLNCGSYDRPVPNENAVHSMEHGAVWITYRPDLPRAQVDQLRSAVPDTYAIISPYPDLPAPVVVSAWGKQLTLTGPGDPRLPEFIRTYRQGPQTPEPGAACVGGING